MEGKKIPKPDNGIRYAYIDDSGLLHVTRWEDDASLYGNGVYMALDDIDGRNGLPEIEGRAYRVWGAGKNWVRISKKTREKFYTKAKDGASKVVVNKDEDKKEAYEILRQIYVEIEEKLDEEEQ